MPPDGPSLLDRLTGARETLALTDLLALAEHPIGMRALRLAGVAPTTLSTIRQAQAAARSFKQLGEVAALLSPRGWMTFELSPLDEHVRAAQLVREGRLQEADELLDERWNQDDAALLGLAVSRVASLYPTPPGGEQDDVGWRRAELVREALECHRDKRYAAAISLTLEQVDGITYDVGGSGVGFFARWKGEVIAPVADEVTLAGHPANLLALARLLTENCPTTETTGRLLRHGIVHGRELAFGTRLNSTKALVALLAVITWAQPIVRAQQAEAQQRFEVEHAGSQETDDAGRRLDRRGFDKAKSALFKVNGTQFGRFESHRRYAASREALDPSGLILEGADAWLQSSADGREYWAWLETPTGLVLGIAGRDGDYAAWLFAGETAPVGGVDADMRWRHVTEEASHLDW